MTDYARSGEPIPSNSSFPYGETKCIIRDGFVTDGTVMDGYAVKIAAITTPRTLAQTAADTDVVAGILDYDPTWVDSSNAPCAKGTAPKTGQNARICVLGPVCARVTMGSGANKMCGESLGVTAAGKLITAADGKNPCAYLLDDRVTDNATSEHIVYFHGNHVNST
jgi:hypothetical protein